MDKLTAIKIKYDDGTYSDEIPVSVLSENVEWDNTHTLVDVLGSIDVDVTGTIQDQISQLFNEKVSVSALQSYVASQLNTNITEWLNTNVNPVGSAVIVDSSLSVEGGAADAYWTGLMQKNDEIFYDIIGKIINTGGAISTYNGYKVTDFIKCNKNSLIILKNIKAGSSSLAYAFYDSNKNFISGQNNIEGNLIISEIPDNTAYVRLGTAILANESYAYIYYNMRIELEHLDEITKSLEYSENIQKCFLVAFNLHGFLDATGEFIRNEQYRASDFIKFDQNQPFYIKNPNSGPSSLAYAFYDEEQNFISGQNNIHSDIIVDTFPNEAKFLRFSHNIASNTEVYVFNNIHSIELLSNNIDELSNNIDELSNNIDELEYEINTIKISPTNTTFFEGFNVFNIDTAVLYKDRFINTTGEIRTSNTVNTLVIPVLENTTYSIYIPNTNRSLICESEDNNFTPGLFKPMLHSSPTGFPITISTSANIKYIGVYFNSGEYDWDTYKNEIIINQGSEIYDGDPYIPERYLPQNLSNLNPLKDTNILIFGDSITVTCYFQRNSNNETTSVTWNNPSNSYVDEHGNTIRFSMWAKILKETQPINEIRNYGFSGASWKTSTRQTGNELQNVHYQIDVALADRLNPQNIWTVDEFYPDIIIWALGTNDGTPNDTFDAAMSKTVLKSDGYSIDVDATIANLDESKTCESMRKAFMRIKKQFPLSQMYCVLPIQRANNEVNWQTLREYLQAMALRYGCIIIDGTGNTGIVRDFNTNNDLGIYLKDGLHPNEKGQNLMARTIISSLKAHYIPYTEGFNL